MDTITNTAIVNRSYNSRGLITHRASTHSLVRLTDETLWAAVRENHLRGEINLYRSEDRGFTWENVFRGAFPTGLGWGSVSTIRTGEVANGPFLSLNVFENLNRLVLWHSLSINNNPVRVWPFVFDLTTGERLEEPYAPPSNAEFYDIDADEMAVKAAYNENTIYICYVRNSQFRIRTFRPNRMVAPVSDTGASSTYNSNFDVSARNDGIVDIAIERGNGIYYLRHNESTNSYSGRTLVGSGNSIHDLNISRDGAGHLLISWGDMGQVRCSISTNNGSSWNPVHIPEDYDVFHDSITFQPSTRLHSIAGVRDFLISYTRNKGGTPRTFVRKIESGQAQEAMEIGTSSHAGDPIVGARFFKTPATRQVDLSNPGWTRVAFQVGQGDSMQGRDSVPVRFAQETLNESAYITPEREPETDRPSKRNKLVRVKVLDGPSTNIDYYAEGAVGVYTARSIVSFKRVGTPLRFARYEPNREAEVGDRSAYGAPEEILINAIVTAITYDKPFAVTQDSFTTHIERDVRKIHIPANLHISRQFVLNRGNHLKRTVWTVLFGGNEYEISQVVPNFIDGQITHYTANMYVIGPSYDPFSRKTLPSET